MSDDRAVARADLDRADKLIVSGANTVFTNNKKTAYHGSVTQSGNAVTQGDTTVFVENKEIARAGDNTARNVPIVLGSPNVFAEDITPSTQEVAENDDNTDDSTPSGNRAAYIFLQKRVASGAITQAQADKVIQYAAPPVYNDPPYTPVPQNGNVLVLMFRGINDKPGFENSSVGVDLTAAAINKISGYRAQVFNYNDNLATIKSSIKADDNVILYGFSAGGETVRRFATQYSSQKIALVLILDAYPAPINFVSNLPSNVDRGIDWYNPNWGYLHGLAPSGTIGKGQHIQDPSTPSNATHFNFPQKHLQDVLTAVQSVKTVPPRQPINPSADGENPRAGGQGKYNTPYTGIVGSTSFPLTMKLSPSFTLGDMIYSFKGKLQTFRHPIGSPIASNEQVVGNLSILAQNVIEPLYQKFPDMFFTSTNRNESGGSQHNVGQACDIQFTSGSSFSKQYDRAMWVRDNLPYDQLILETTVANPLYWIHISYNARGNRSPSDPAKYFTRVESKDIKFQKFRQFTDYHSLR